MKLSSRILVTLSLLLVAGLLTSNIILRKEYNALDKSDVYWTYRKVSEKPFRYLKVTGGNITNLTFEQSPHCSVRILRNWERYHGGSIMSEIKNDTLFIKFPPESKDLREKFWMRGAILVRIFCPELLAADCYNSNFNMFKLQQKNITAKVWGRSKFEVESLIQDLDSVNIIQTDSSEVIFEMSPDFKPKNKKDLIVGRKVVNVDQLPENIKSLESMNIQFVDANIKGNSLLDIGHAQINKLRLSITDSSGIILSGGSLRKFKQ